MFWQRRGSLTWPRVRVRSVGLRMMIWRSVRDLVGLRMLGILLRMMEWACRRHWGRGLYRDRMRRNVMLGRDRLVVVWRSTASMRIVSSTTCTTNSGRSRLVHRCVSIHRRHGIWVVRGRGRRRGVCVVWGWRRRWVVIVRRTRLRVVRSVRTSHGYFHARGDREGVNNV